MEDEEILNKLDEKIKQLEEKKNEQEQRREEDSKLETESEKVAELNAETVETAEKSEVDIELEKLLLQMRNQLFPIFHVKIVVSHRITHKLQYILATNIFYLVYICYN